MNECRMSDLFMELCCVEVELCVGSIKYCLLFVYLVENRTDIKEVKGRRYEVKNGYIKQKNERKEHGKICGLRPGDPIQ
ncbi:hypothetical protein RUM43_007646 [Polyplax serrata]|uniref:Uncharacterized protein n=1 Tax=Polyplax serrata TaxID=468196 RepID=A0AAN8Q6B1_POLSC